MAKRTAGAHRTRAFLHVTRYLRIDWQGGCEMTARAPALGIGQIAMELTLAIPTRLFDRPLLAATIAIPADAALPERVTAEVIQTIRRAAEDATGLELQVELVPRRPRRRPDPEGPASAPGLDPGAS